MLNFCSLRQYLIVVLVPPLVGGHCLIQWDGLTSVLPRVRLLIVF